jgi:hypothetical protein
MIDVAGFRSDFPEFGDTGKYPDSGVTYWMNLAGALFTGRWGLPAPIGQPPSLYDLGVELFTAHNLALERRAQNEAASGAVPGMSTGLVNSKSVNGVSLSFNTTLGIEQGAGYYNLTVYGLRFWNLLQMIGMGPITIVAPGSVNGPYVGPTFAQGIDWDM